jgi:hypothetical protein
MYVCMRVCMFQHNSGTPGTISTKLGTHLTTCIYKHLMYILYIQKIKMDVCVYVCSSITLERLERIQPNLAYIIWMYVCLIEDWDK